jgi:threonyl-tRNA synthetase
MSFRVILPDQSVKTFESQPTGLKVAESIGSRLAKDTIGVMISSHPFVECTNPDHAHDDILDLRTAIPDNSYIKLVTVKDVKSVEVQRHSAAHVMAQAVQELFPGVLVTIGPVIENGFFYDFDAPKPFSPEDLEKIEERMKQIVKKDLEIRREEWPVDQAIETFRKMGEKYKVELITELKAKGEKTVGVYFQGEWFDLCRGPHVQRTSQIGAIKVLSNAGSYWRGDEKREHLQRVYATAFGKDDDLKLYLHNLEEAKKRDHRRLGKDMGLFTFSQLSPGAPFFTPNGTIIYNELQRFIRDKYLDYGYQEVITPQIFDVDLYHQSGHYENYRENMYFSKIDERDFSMKPMNCPGHCLLYASDHRSYRDLPWRVADFGRLHRYERSGVMHGLTRVRSFSQDDAHIFCAIEQLQSEIESFMKFLDEVYTSLGMADYHVYLSTRPEKRMGGDEIWDMAENALREALARLNLKFTINAGDGAFYGPKLDIMFVDAIKRPWQLGTLQCDFNMPKAFNLKFVGVDNSEHAPVMLHRAILGSFERFIGVYLEHTAGHLPMWLAPTQVKILNITNKQADYGKEIEKILKSKRLRAHFDGRSEKLGYKIREAQMAKVPYMVVIGDQEVLNRTVSLRLPDGGQLTGVSLETCVETLVSENAERSFDRKFKATVVNSKNQNSNQEKST